MTLELVGRFGLSGLPNGDVSHALVGQCAIDVTLALKAFEEQANQIDFKGRIAQIRLRERTPAPTLMDHYSIIRSESCRRGQIKHT